MEREEVNVPRLNVGLSQRYARALDETAPQPTQQQLENKIRPTSIEEVNFGYIVRIGCQTFAISTKAELTSKLIEYINEPAKTEQKWLNKTCFDN